MKLNKFLFIRSILITILLISIKTVGAQKNTIIQYSDTISFDTIKNVNRIRYSFVVNEKKPIGTFSINYLLIEDTIIGAYMVKKIDIITDSTIGVQVLAKEVLPEYYIFNNAQDSFSAVVEYDTLLRTFICNYFISSSGYYLRTRLALVIRGIFVVEKLQFCISNENRKRIDMIFNQLKMERIWVKLE